MFISFKSIFTFFYINVFLIGISYCKLFFIGNIFKNCALLLFIYNGTSKKKFITNRVIKVTQSDIYYFLSSTCIQSITEKFTERFAGLHSTKFFVIYLFLFEIVLDFFHYTLHRFMHQKWYRFHKVHHRFTHPTILSTYCHHPVDLLLLESLPTITTLWIFKGVFSCFQMNLLFVYKSFIEISGHSGKHLAPSSCFPLCVWLPRILGIQLYTEDHELHHNCSTINFSKRFSLWDRVFGTYRRF
jgi:sterol desaturase/sphingolipid hydroxylase (fatty acid hydroxylase superfamily)